jgi:hypothetical protein
LWLKFFFSPKKYSDVASLAQQDLKLIGEEFLENCKKWRNCKQGEPATLRQGTCISLVTNSATFVTTTGLALNFLY